MARSGILVRRAAILPQSSSTGDTPYHRQRPEPVRPDELAAATKRLTELRRRSLSLSSDWETLGEMDRILSTLTASELAAIYKQIDHPTGYDNMIFAAKVGGYWAEKDPDGAIQAALSISSVRNELLAIKTFQVWSGDHPKEALAWLESDGLSAGLSAKLAANMRAQTLGSLAERDFSFAGAEFLKMKGEGADQLIREWGSIYSDDPQMRQTLIDFTKSTGRPEDYAKLNSELISSWPQDDALGMLNYIRGLKTYLESDAVPAEARADTDAASVAVAIHREYTGPALEWWMERHADSPITPAPLQEAIQSWAIKTPDVAVQWLAQQPESPQRDAFNASAIVSFVNTGHYPEAVQSIANIQDPGIQQQAIERLDYIWTQKDAAGAAAWRATLPGGAVSTPGK